MTTEHLESLTSDIRASLWEKLKRAQGQYDALRREVEGRVVRREWATDERYALEPLYHEVHGSGRGALLTGEPSSKKNKYLFGWDADGQLRLVRTWRSAPSGLTQTSRYITGTPEHLTEWVFRDTAEPSSGSAAPLSLRERTQREGQILYTGVGRPPNWHATLASTDQGRIQRLVFATNLSPAGIEYAVQYDPDGQLESLTLGERVVYSRPKRPLEEVLREMRDLLVVRTPHLVARHAPTEPLYALALTLGSEGLRHALPPRLGLGVSSHREALRPGGQGPADLERVWNPREFDDEDAEVPTRYPIDFEDEDLMALGLEAGILLTELVSEQPALDMLVEVARALNGQDWTPFAATTADFLVYATTPDAGAWRKSLPQSAPRAKVAQLARAGWLP